MSRKEKLLKRFISEPKDFTFEELVRLLNDFGFKLLPGGKTCGSRIAFANEEGVYIKLHKPHPRNILKMYQVEKIKSFLKERELI